MATPSKVTRITAKDNAAKEATKEPKKAKKISGAPKSGKKNIFSRFIEYVKGAWFELRQVRWPNRQATWSLTIAVIVFSLFLMGLIVLLDFLFNKLFEIIIA